ncbi:phage capsid protein, partial [Escherichia coli]|nr:phage capsid protein [Escherichia coli]
LKAANEKTIADLAAKLDHTPARDPQRPAATGASGAVVTDC